ncbi:hypothetical protein F2Q70_00018398 [Brassica cretica]|uniref:Armadillo repeat-containing domain-containing protein n=1 Tax=Brassica cretica TaxID=69181 RepID=A0A8S9HZG4_BRACR|nr:hypothetical protein F2Q70_00018398 [Brassica cretica]
MKRHGIQSNTLRARKLKEWRTSTLLRSRKTSSADLSVRRCTAALSPAPYGRHVFLCYKSHETWLPRVESEGLPHRFAKSFKDRRADFAVEARGALETLLGALTPIDHARAQKTEVHAALMNSVLLSRGAENITLLLSLLEEEDFYVRYYTLQILTALLMNSQNRLQEAILTTPRGITRLMDMLMDREVTVNYILDIFNVAISLFKSLVIRNEAFLLLTHLTREAEDCLELLKNLLRNSSSNQILLRETMGFEPIISVLDHRTVNLLCALETINMLIMGGAVTDPGKDSNKLANRTVLVQTFKCIGDLVDGHPKNRDILASKVLGEDRQAEPALNSIRIILQTSSIQEFVAADYVFKTFCELSTVLFLFHYHCAFDLMLLYQILLEFKFVSVCYYEAFALVKLMVILGAASILSHVVKDNIQCKKKALKIVLESHVPSMGTPEPLFQRIVSFIFSSSSEGPREDHEPLTRTATPSEAEIEDVDVAGAMDKGNEDHPMLISLLDPSFTGLVKSLEGSTQERRLWGDSIFGRDDQLRKYPSKRPWLFRESRS